MAGPLRHDVGNPFTNEFFNSLVSVGEPGAAPSAPASGGGADFGKILAAAAGGIGKGGPVVAAPRSAMPQASGHVIRTGGMPFKTSPFMQMMEAGAEGFAAMNAMGGNLLGDHGGGGGGHGGGGEGEKKKEGGGLDIMGLVGPLIAAFA